MTGSSTARRVALSDSLRIQGRVLWALILRESLTRYGRHNIGFLWLFVEPMMFTLGVTTIWTIFNRFHGYGLPIVEFAISSYSTVLLWRNMPSRCVGAVGPNHGLLYHRNVHVLDLFLSRIILEAAGATISLFTLSIVFYALGAAELPEDILKVAYGWVMLAWFGAALAILLGSLAEQSELVEKLWHPAAYLLFPLSGAAFLVDALPAEAQQAILWLPMVNAVEYVREGYLGSKIVAHHDMTYLAVWNIGLTCVALWLVRRVDKNMVLA